MEFLRFGSSIPGSYWGCCAVDIIQDFKQYPSDKASIQVVTGDGGGPIGDTFCGPTWEDIFWQRLRIGTFADSDMPNHAFIAVLTDQQIYHEPGNLWLAILKKAGFEFIRTVDNSVYGSNQVGIYGYDDDDENGCSHPNHIFMLVRNIASRGKIQNPYRPPAAWLELPSVGVPELHTLNELDGLALNFEMQKAHEKIWMDNKDRPFLTRQKLEEAKVPVYLAGLRSNNPQELASTRENRNKKSGKTEAVAKPFG